GDLGLTVPILGLIGVSLAVIGSTAPALFSQQLIFFVIGFALYLIFSSLDYRLWKRFNWVFYIFSLLFLISAFFGVKVRGASRWIDIAGINLQPSELIKPLFILVIVSFLVKEARQGRLKSLLMFLPILILIFRQPDLGNVLVYLFTYLAIMVADGLPLLYLAISSLVFGILLPLFWFILKDYQKIRLLSFINPYADPLSAGYNSIQAMIALGSGQLMGLGLGRGTQSHLRFLPEFHTDFVFASLGEELGFIGASMVIIFYLILLGRILKAGSSTGDDFGKLLTLGIFAQLFIQVFINIGMNLGLLPITGITLPLLSYGGSSIISTFIELGLIASVLRISRARDTIVIR
ncbi:rod shape-determining protein RodA, partial [Candidatus Gottesmanbacteria bacterium]|nr:rod shape-determining protein RodA [Candidatus Gottesmanbacteria bacterium]